MTELEKINKQGISIVISAREEERTLPLTINALMEDMYTSEITKWEVIVVDNGSLDETSKFFSWRRTDHGDPPTLMYSPRGLVNEGRLRLFFDPVPSNVNARNKGVYWARYDNIIFSDAHMGIRPGSILSLIKSLDKYGGIIHAAVSWMGASCDNPQAGYQYSYKVGEKGPYGNWNKIKVADTPFYIPLCGHCFLAVKKKEFQEKLGYPTAQRVYGGGEPYLDTVYWMTGSTSMCDPNCLVFHLSAGRSYSYHSDDLIHNMFLVSYILGGQKWIDRTMITYLNKFGENPIIRRLYDEAIEGGEEQKKWLDENKIMTFEELLRLDWKNDCDKCTKRGSPDPHPMRPWDVKNEELHGKHRSFVAEFGLRKEDGKVFVGNTQIVRPEAIELAEKYL